jgi:hypothetical protein
LRSSPYPGYRHDDTSARGPQQKETVMDSLVLTNVLLIVIAVLVLVSGAGTWRPR